MATRTRLASAVGTGALAAVPAIVASTCIVHPGDTMSAIAIRHGVTVASLARANGLSDVEILQPGRMLQIPDATLSLPDYTRGSADVEVHPVRPGEGVLQIARQFGLDPTALARSNGINVNTQLGTGTELQVPGRLVRVNALLTHVAHQVGAQPAMVRAVAWRESQWRQETVSPTGAVGLMQLEPFSGEWVSRHLADRKLNIWVAQDNVLAGALLLQHLTSLHDGDVGAALAAYYQGDASVAENGAFEDTQRYVAAVQHLIALDG